MSAPAVNALARLQPGERATLTNYTPRIAPASPDIKLISSADGRREGSAAGPIRKRTGMKDGDTFGTEELCTWSVAPGTCWFQTRRPDFARKLSQRSGASLVACCVHGGYLRIFEETIEPWRARHLVRRFFKAD
jgi:hypothetical protein